MQCCIYYFFDALYICMVARCDFFFSLLWVGSSWLHHLQLYIVLQMPFMVPHPICFLSCAISSRIFFGRVLLNFYFVFFHFFIPFCTQSKYVCVLWLFFVCVGFFLIFFILGIFFLSSVISAACHIIYHSFPSVKSYLLLVPCPSCSTPQLWISELN